MNGKVRVYDFTSDSHIMMDRSIKLPCGSLAHIDHEAGFPLYRCEVCNAVPGSVGMPRDCYKLYNEVK